MGCSPLAAQTTPMDKFCILRNVEEETTFHLFTQCPLTQSLWLSSSWAIQLNRLLVLNTTNYMRLLKNPSTYPNFSLEKTPKFLLFSAVACDQIWLHRKKLNKSHLQGHNHTPPPIYSHET